LGDAVESLLLNPASTCQSYFSVNRSEAIKIASGKVAVAPASEDNGESCAKWTPAFSIAMDGGSSSLLFRPKS